MKLKALDKITAKTSNINIPLGKKKKFGYLEIYPRKCALSNTENEKGVVAYIQVKDLSNKKDERFSCLMVGLFIKCNFANIRSCIRFVVTGCENI